ncbi:trp operon leader peptide [Escherichia coli]|nr:trp operon leader peptide [Escherichia coli]EFL3663719.1 trp operon leader peptide [Escherichia coli]NVL95993.1 trp operon leader peptide [Escherichia coli]QLQ60298.1 trp operon leader peptide [Escherichia coli]
MKAIFVMKGWWRTS